MAGREWTITEIEYLKTNAPTKTCKEIAKEINRSEKSVQHRFNYLGLKHKRAVVGDIVNGWEILSIESRPSGNQNISYAKIRSILEDKTEKEERLTKLTLAQIGWPDRRRPDLASRNLTHGDSRSRLYRIWNAMKNRCSYSKGKQYKDYGGRGIKVCEEWAKFESFRDWANSNGYSEELTLDRLNVDGNYEPSNCKWSTWTEQASNKRNSLKISITAFDETKDVYLWSSDARCVVDSSALAYRINAGWNPEEAITKPSERIKRLKLKDWLDTKYPNIYQEFLNQ